MKTMITLVQTGLWTEGAEFKKTIAFEDEEDAWNYCLRHYDISNLDRANREKTKHFRGVFRLNKRWVLITNIKFFPKRHASLR